MADLETPKWFSTKSLKFLTIGDSNSRDKSNIVIISIEVDGQTNKEAAWYYPSTKEKAKHFEGYIAVWKGVKFQA